MKLELKHIAPYLPYGLNGIQNHFPHEDKDRTLRPDNVDFFLKYCKPYLRPLSDLTKEIEHNGERFVPIEEKPLSFYWDKSVGFIVGYDYGSEEVSFYEIYEKMFEWHLDVFGLIEKGLAIDKNDIK